MLVSVLDRDGGSVALWWRGVEGAECYEVEMRKGQEEFVVLSSSVKGTTLRKKNLEKGIDYEFRVTAVKDGSKTDVSDIVKTSVVDGPQMGAPKCADYDGSSAVVTWNNEDGPYSLEMFEDGEWSLVAGELKGLAARKRNLRHGRRYYFRVKSNSRNWSLASEAVSLPKKAPMMASYFGEKILNQRGDFIDTMDALAGRIVAVYASASW